MSLIVLEGVLLCIVGGLLVCKVIPPNRRFGLRTARTLADPVAWHRAHRAFGFVVLTIGLIVAVVAGLWPTTPAHPALGLVGALSGALAFLVVYRRYAA
jgi:uncharacterized membrane protein